MGVVALPAGGAVCPAGSRGDIRPVRDGIRWGGGGARLRRSGRKLSARRSHRRFWRGHHP